MPCSLPTSSGASCRTCTGSCSTSSPSMPELPEVETIRSQLAPRLEGTDARTGGDPRSAADPAVRPLRGRGGARGRHASSPSSDGGSTYSLRLESGLGLLVHLRMTGSFTCTRVRTSARVLELDDGSRSPTATSAGSGRGSSSRTSTSSPYLATKNGPEPLGRRFTPRWLAAQLARRKAPLKAVLLDQRVVAGLGNIYADEALWRARLSPLRPANGSDGGRGRAPHARDSCGAARGNRASGIDAQRLRSSRRRRRARCRTSSASTVATASRAPAAATTIAKTRVGGRGTWFCPRCQPLPV